MLIVTLPGRHVYGAGSKGRRHFNIFNGLPIQKGSTLGRLNFRPSFVRCN